MCTKRSRSAFWFFVLTELDTQDLAWSDPQDPRFFLAKRKLQVDDYIEIFLPAIRSPIDRLQAIRFM